MAENTIPITRSSMPSIEEYVEKIRPIWENHWLTNMGALHQKLTDELKEKERLSNVSLFVNGHMALELAIQVLNLKGEVITSPFTFASTTHAIVRNGLIPIFCDIDPVTYTIDVDKIEALITERTCAIVPVHVYGNICDVEAIKMIAKKHNLKVIYDAAHAFHVQYKGRNIANYGDMSMFSFHATKVFNTIEGGAIIYQDEKYGEKLERIKNFGIRDEEHVDYVGANAKMNEFQAAMGLCNLENLDVEIKRRKEIAERYDMHLREIEGIQLKTEQVNVKSNYSYYPILINSEILNISRDEVCRRLKEKGIGVRKYFYPLTSEYECFRTMFDKQDTPIAKRISENIITLPLYAELSLDSVDLICKTLLQIIHTKAVA